MEEILRGTLAFKGERGYSAYEVAVQNGFEGTVEEWLIMCGVSEDVTNMINAKINGLASGSPLVANSTSGMTDETHIYVNTTDGNWYYYNGSTWAIGGVYQATGIAEESINYKKTDFINRVTNNLINKNDINYSGYYDTSGIFHEDTYYPSTGFINIEGCTKICTNLNGYITLWNSNKEFIEGYNPTSILEITKNNACYVNIAFHSEDMDSIFVVDYSNSETLYDYGKLDGKKIKIGESNILNNSVSYNKTTFLKEEWSKYSNRVTTEDIQSNTSLNELGELIVDIYNTCGYIKCNELENLAINNGGARVCFYDEDYKFLSQIVNITGNERFEFTTPIGTRYIRAVTPTLPMVLCLADIEFTEAKEHKIIVIADEKLKDAVNPNNHDLKINCLGDSITVGYNNNDVSFADYLNYTTVRKYGESGTTIAQQENVTNSFLERYAEMDNDADIILVMGGTNDFGLNIPLGDIDSTNTYSFYGALKSLATGLINKYPGKKIVFITELDRVINTNSIDVPYTSYLTAIKEVCRSYAIPVLDLNSTLGFTAKNTKQAELYLPDYLHPNNEGHKIIADKIEKYISYQL